jgi:YVTN family beta-propeller protein
MRLNPNLLGGLFSGRASWLYPAGAILTAFVCCPAVGAQNRIYVSNDDNNTAVVIDATTLSRIATVPIGNDSQGLGISPDGTRLYVTASGGVTVIDTVSNGVLATIPIVGPWGVAFSPTGTYAYVGESLGVAVITLSTNTVLSHIAFGTYGAYVAITPDGMHAYVSGGGGNVFVIDLGRNTVTASIPIAGASDLRGVAISPDGTHAYVVSVQQGTVSVINTATNTVAGTIAVGPLPIGIAVTPDGTRAYVAVTYGPAAVIDLATNSVSTTISIPNHPALVAISSDGTRAYFTDQIQAVAVVDTTTNAVIAEVPTGGQAYGVAVTPIQAISCPLGPSINSITPNSGGNAGSVTITLSGGCGSHPGQTLKNLLE